MKATPPASRAARTLSIDSTRMLGSHFSILTTTCRLTPAALASSSWLRPSSARAALIAVIISDVESMDS